MLVDSAGLAAAAARLTDALSAAGGDAVHPPLGADPASLGAAQRLSTAAAALAGSLTAQLSALIATAEHLGLVAAGYVATDEANAHTIANLGGGGGGPRLSGSAPSAPALPPDLRVPLPPPPPPSGPALSAAVHAGNPAAGEPYSASWTRVAAAAGAAAETVRSVIGHLPESLDTDAATPAVTAHLTSYAQGFDAAGQRASTLASQAASHADLRSQAGQQIPTPQDFTDANDRVQRIGLANLRSRGALAVPYAQAQADLQALNTRAVTSYAAYHSGTDIATDGDQTPTDPTDPAQVPGEGAPGAGRDRTGGMGVPGATGPGAGAAETNPAADAASPQGMDQLASILPQMIPTVLGAAGGLLGGLTKVPETLMQGGMQAMQGLTGVASAKPDTTGGLGDPTLSADPALGDPGLGDGAGGGGGGEVTPASGGPPMVPASVTPSTGPPPTPPSIPTGGGLPPPVAPGFGSMGGGMPMGMPMGGMGGGGGGGAKGEQPQQKKVVTPPLPHTEAVTGKVNADRMAVASGARTDRDDPPDDDPPTGPRNPLVRRITMPVRDDEP